MRPLLAVMILTLLPLMFHPPQVAGAASDFTLSAFYSYDSSTPSNVIIVTGQSGFTGRVGLTLSSPSGFYASLSQGYADLNTTLTQVNVGLQTSASQPGNYTVVVTGTQGALSHSVTIRYNIRPSGAPDLQIYSNLGLTYGWRIIRGSSSESLITVTSKSGFSGTASLQVASFPSGLILSLDSPSVTVQPGYPGATNLKVSVPDTAVIGTYTVVVSVSSGSLAQVAFLDVVLTYGFAMDTNPASLTVVQGGQAISTLTLSSLGGWTGSTQLSASCGVFLTCYLSSPSLTLTGSGSSQTTVFVRALSTTPPGSYGVGFVLSNVVPDASEIQLTSVNLVVTGPDFAISVDPLALTFTPNVSATLNATVSLASLDGFTGYVNSTITILNGNSTSLSVSPALTSLQVTPSGQQNFKLTVSVNSTVAVGRRDVQIEAVTSTPGGQLSHTIYVPLIVGPDFNMSASPINLVVHQGTLAISTLTFHSLNGFAGLLGTLAEPLPVIPPYPSIDINCNGTSLILTPDGTRSCIMTVMATDLTRIGTYSITAGASYWGSDYAYSIGHDVPMTITVEGPVTGPDFELSAQHSHVYVSIGSTTTSNITLSSINGFVGSLTLRAEAYGVIGSLNPETVTISPTSSSSATLRITTPIPEQIASYPLWFPASGPRSILIIATNSTGFSHWAWVNETVTPFNLVPTPSQLDIRAGSSATSSLTVTSQSGFNQTLTLSTSIIPSGPTSSLNESHVDFSASQDPSNIILTVNVPSTVPRGDYVLTITATYLSFEWFCRCNYELLNYSTPIRVHVADLSPGSAESGGNIFGLPPIQFYAIIATATVAVIGSAMYLRIRRSRANRHSNLT